MKKKIFLLLTIVAVLFSACKKTGTKEESPAEDSISVTTEISESRTTPDVTLDWEGEYKGILPCADCDGMEVSLILNFDSTFTQSTHYIGKGGPYEEEGTFSWDETGGIVVLKLTDGSEAKYRVEEDMLILLDEYGYPYEGDEYVLRR